MSEEIGVTNLRLKYPGEEAPLLFQGVSFSVKPGEKVLLLGPSGCGKSTLLQVLSGIVPGIIELPLKADRVSVPSRWGYVFQDPDAQFCMPYVDEEIAFVLENMQVPREEMPARIERYLQLVGLRLEDPHTWIGQLSQGMKQRLAIASVLALEPQVLFLDEPTALLDEEGTRLVWETIRSISADKTLVIVEHKISGILEMIDRLIVISPDGEVLADGQPDVIFQSYRKQLADYGIWYPGVWDDMGLWTADGVQRTAIGPAAAPAAAPTAVATDEPAAAQATVPAAEPPPAPPARQPVVQFEGFTGLRGGQIRTSVDNLSVYPGDWIAVTGSNGAGKSSLLLAMMRLIPTRGSCRVAGAKGSKVEQLAELVGFVFQNPEFQFVTNSVEEELAYSLPGEDGPAAQQALVEELLRQYDLLGLRKRHPFQLSMGQKRRLSVATAMVRGPRVLLLDEPTFGLDARGTMRMLEQLERLRAAGTAIVMVTHDDEIVQRCATRVWQVEAGRVAETPLTAPPVAQAPPIAQAGERGAMACK